MTIGDPAVVEPACGVVLMLGTSMQTRGGVAAVVTTLRESGFFERARVRYVATHVDGGRWRKLVQFAHACVVTVRALRSGTVSLVHAHVASNASFWRKAFLLWVARRFRVATVFHLHGGGFEAFAGHGFGGPVLRGCIRRTLESSDVVIVLSERWAAWVSAFAPRSRIRVIGNPVRCVRTASLSTRRVRPTGYGGRVLFLGMICQAKGTFDLLRAWAQARPRIGGWRLVICGNGEAEPLFTEAARLGMRDDIEYLGWVTGDDKERELAAADIFVLPSYVEGMPMAVLEAMAHGVAVITTPVGGVPDMMEPGRHGLWVEPGNIQALAGCLERLAHCPELRAKLGEAARHHVLEHYSVEAVEPQLSKVHHEAVESARR